MAFDTHENFKRLTKAGADEELAEAIIKCQSASQSELATKANIDRLEAKLEGRIGKLEAKVEADMAKLEASTREAMAELKTAMAEQESRLIKWVVGMAIGIVFSQTALTVALIKLLP